MTTTRTQHIDRNGDPVSSWSGFAYSTIARSTGALIVVVDNRDEAWETDNPEKWLTICDKHATVCSHRTHRLARDHAAAPEGWCEGCMTDQGISTALVPEIVEPVVLVVPTEVFTEPAPRRFSDVRREALDARCTIEGAHCESCGSTDYEDLHCGDQGYTACCNELIAYGSRDCRAHHVH